MQHNLEGIEFDEVTVDGGTSYAAYREQLSPRYSRVFLDILKGYFFLALTCAACLYFGKGYPEYWWLIIIAGSIAIGYCTAYLALFIHEAGHFNIHPDKKTNDRLATIFLCLPFGLSLKAYRKIHWQHHIHLGTPEDTEVSYFNALTKLFVVEMLTGVHLVKTMIRKGKNSVLTKEQLRNSRLMLLAGILFHLAILVPAFLTGNWAFALAWIAGFGLVLPFFAAIRQILEHRDELAPRAVDFYTSPHGKVSRIFVHSILSSSFGSAGFTRHMIHHWDPQISYTRLGDIEAFLSRSGRTADLLKNSRTTYGKTLKKLLKAR